jgi:DNA-binding response OmpR family regulator
MAGKRILIVEDDPAMAGMIDDLLRRHGYATQLAGDTAAALAAFKKQVPDAIILDFMLPGVGGAALREEIREINGGGQIPVLFLSALPQRDLRGAVFDGTTYYMTKPYKAVDFLEVVNQMVALASNPSGF